MTHCYAAVIYCEAKKKISLSCCGIFPNWDNEKISLKTCSLCNNRQLSQLPWYCTIPHYGRFDDSVIFDYKSLLWGNFSVRINNYVYEILSKLSCIGIITIYNTLTVKNHGSVKLKKPIDSHEQWRIELTTLTCKFIARSKTLGLFKVPVALRKTRPALEFKLK